MKEQRIEIIRDRNGPRGMKFDPSISPGHAEELLKEHKTVRDLAIYLDRQRSMKEQKIKIIRDRNGPRGMKFDPPISPSHAGELLKEHGTVRDLAIYLDKFI